MARESGSFIPLPAEDGPGSTSCLSPRERAAPDPAFNRRALLGWGLAALSGCAQNGGAPRPQPQGFSRPHLERDAFVSFDGARLPLKVWSPEGAFGARNDPKIVVLGLHGFDDYAEAFDLAGRFWAKRGVTTYAFDQRGFGRAPDRGLWVGARLLAEDARAACALLRARHPEALLAVAGESMGGAVAITAFASDRPASADRLVLLSPAVWGWRKQPLANAVGLWLIAHAAPWAHLDPPPALADAYPVTDDAEIVRRMADDPNIIASTRADAAYGLVDLMQEASDRIGRLRLPTLYLYGAQDRLIPRTAAFDAVSHLGPSARTAYYEQGWHLLDRDRHASEALEDALSFIRDPNAPLPSNAPPIPVQSRLA